MKPDLSLASLSDVHLGHPKTPTLHITTNLCREFPDGPSTHSLDLILNGGDLFNHLLTGDLDDIPQILEWAGHTMKMCERERIHYVLMEGTPSHDRRQARMLEVLKRMGIGSTYFHYITELSIVRFDDLDIDILFVPDEWRPEPDDTWMEVRELLREKNLEKVDFTVLHGTFDFQLPEHIKVPRHVLSRYESITRHYIFGAHIHTASVKGKALVNGSFDRLAHNEEEDKGHWRIKFDPNHPPEPKFVVNKNAKVYKTIECSGLDLDMALDKIRTTARSVPERSHLRIKSRKGDPILSNLDVIRKEFTTIHWTTKEVDGEAVQKNLLVDLRSSFTSIQITPENIEELLMNKVNELTLDPELRKRCRDRLLELI